MPKPEHKRVAGKNLEFKEPVTYGNTLAGGAEKYLLVIGLLATVFLGGGTPVWMVSILMFVAGLWVILRPPARTPSRKMDWFLVLFVLWGLSAFVPYGLLGKAAWRDDLAESGLNLSWTSSPQPWVSAEVILIILTGILWFYLIWNLNPDHEDRRRMLWVLVLGSGLLGVGQVYAAMNNITSPFQAKGLGFSYFPNKNQNGLFFAMSGAAAFGLTIHTLRCRRRSTIIAGLCLLACLLGVIYSVSRASILLFFFGCLVSYIAVFDKQGGFRLLRLALPMIIAGMIILLALGRDSLSRFALWGDGVSSVLNDLRFDIYRDTYTMIKHLPPYAATAGNFETVFPLFRNHSIVAESIIHPESDWMWILAEFGVPGFSLMLMAVIALSMRLLPFGDLHSRSYRAPALGGVVIFLIHSCVDVPAHRFGTILIAFLLYRLATESPKLKEVRIIFPRWGIRVLGIIVMLTGATWTVASIFGLPWNTAIVQKNIREVLSQPFTTNSQTQSTKALDRAFSAHPMDWWNHMAKARYQLAYERDAQEAQQAFTIARSLEPTSSEIPFREGITWMQYNPRLAARAWREALGRETVVKESLHREMLDIGGRRPQFAREMANLSILDPDLRYRYLTARRGATFDEAIFYEQNQDPNLERFTKRQRANILERWARYGNQKNLRAHLLEYPEVTSVPWYYNALAWAVQKDYQKAVNTAQPHVTFPRSPVFTQFAMATDNELRKDFLLNPNDVVKGSILLERQLNKQDWTGALDTSKKLVNHPPVPNYARFWKGELERQKGLYQDAWSAWQPYLEELAEKSDGLKE